jgi:hypothetical protein
MIGLLNAPATRERINAAIVSSPPHLHPVLVAVRDCGVGMLFVPQGPGKFVIPSPRPAVVMIGDDMEQAVGPTGFHLPSIRRAIRACDAFADLYATLASTAVGGGKAMIVETRLAHEFAWIELIQKLAPKRPLCILTVKGGHA